MLERDPRTVIEIRLDTNGGVGIIAQVYGDRGLRTVYVEGRDGKRVASGKLTDREAEARRLAEQLGLPLKIVSHDTPVPAHPATASS